jgi:hypothetical protein
MYCEFEQWTVPPADSTPYCVSIRSILNTDSNSCNDTLGKQVYGLNLLHDVGVDSVTSPPDTILPESLYVPQAWIHNYGISSETFGVECLIAPGTYIDTAIIILLEAGADADVAFSSWAVPSEDSTAYTVCVTTLLPSDMDGSNDSLCTEIYAAKAAISESIRMGGPRSTTLHEAEPNPFRRSALIRYSLSEELHVALSIYDVAGRLVRTIVDSKLNPGEYSVEWDGTNTEGTAVVPGVYLSKLEAGGVSSAKKLVLVR